MCLLAQPLRQFGSSLKALSEGGRAAVSGGFQPERSTSVMRRISGGLSNGMTYIGSGLGGGGDSQPRPLWPFSGPRTGRESYWNTVPGMTVV